MTRIARFETRPDTLRKGNDETSPFIGIYCRQRFSEILGYSKLGRGLPIRETKNTKFHPHFPIGGPQVYRLR